MRKMGDLRGLMLMDGRRGAWSLLIATAVSVPDFYSACTAIYAMNFAQWALQLMRFL